MKENVLDVLMFLFENYLYDEPEEAHDRDSLEENLHQAGFTNAEIAYMLFGEAAVLTLIGLPLGCLLGWLLAVFMAQGFNTELFRIPVVIEASTYGYSMLVVLTSAFASALLVERRLVRLNLISVLKTRE